MLLNVVQEHLKARGDLDTWGLYSLKLKAVPHPKLSKQLPLNALLPGAPPSPLAPFTLVEKVGFGQDRHANNDLLLKLV